MARASCTKNSIFLFSALTIAAVLFIRVRFLDTPLERDEGEYAYIGQLILKGFLPYTDAVNLKFPGIFFAYAGILSLFPNTPYGIHLALLVTNFATALLLFFIGKKLFNGAAGLISSTSFLVTTADPSIHGLWANSEHFLMLGTTAALLLLLHRQTGAVYETLLSGFLLGMSVLIKQHGLIFLLFGALFLACRRPEKEKVPVRLVFREQFFFFSGALIPVLALTVWLVYTDNIRPFWFWTLRYGFEYATVTQLDPEIFRILFRFVASAPGLLLLAGTGMVSIFFHKRNRGDFFFLSGFFGAALLAMSPGLLFRPHYYLLLIPSLSLLAGTAIHTFLTFDFFKRREGLFLFITVAAISFPLFFNKNTFFEISPRDLSRKTFGANPFQESLPIASYLKKNTRPDQKIVVFGSEPQIYFYAEREAGTKYIFTYPLMEAHKFALDMQKEFIFEVERSQPSYIVFVNIATSWLRQEGSHELLFQWLPSYINSGYDPDGVIDLLNEYETTYIFGKAAAKYRPRSRNFIQIYKKANGR